MTLKIILIGVGGFVGSILRYLIYQIIDKYFNQDFPFPTMIVNIIGSFVLGFIITYSFKNSISEPIRLMITVGILGSFTTFSTFSIDSFQLLQNNEVIYFILYVFFSIIFGLGASWVGILLGQS